MAPIFSPPASEDYSDIIVRRQYLPADPDKIFPEQTVNAQYSILYAPLSEGLATVPQIGYSGVPKLFTFQNTTSLEASGILVVQTQPYLSLSGENVLVGFLDSGIDYTHPAFRNPDGTTRILGIWDQSDQSGTPPQGFLYGSSYTAEEINAALFSSNPSAVVPETDEEGHGTAVAGIACGSPDPESDFIGAAPQSNLLFVRLKPAKMYLRDYFLIPDDAVAYQENDLMLGVRYLMQTARALQRPLVICVALGSNQGDHTGNTPLEEVLTAAQAINGTYAVTGTGNEVGASHHYSGRLSSAGDSIDIELLIDRETSGFPIEFWSDSLSLYNIGFLSPLGESILPIYHGPITSRTFHFLLENTKIEIYYTSLEMLTGHQMAFIRMLEPSPGLWHLRITSQGAPNGSFHLWLPVSGLVPPDIVFSSPDPDTTLVIPSCAEPLLSAGAYDAYNKSLFRASGRGYPRSGVIKPDFAAPGVSLSAPAIGGTYQTFTGSSSASALTAGSTALLAEWGRRRYTTRYLSSRELKNLFLRGASQNPSYSYPNREWGYGTMNLSRIFETFGRP